MIVLVKFDINGFNYLCLSQLQIQRISIQLSERGYR